MLKNIIALVGLASIVMAGDFESGVNAFEKKQYQSAFQYFSKACEKGDANSCLNLGNTYYDGSIVKQNRVKAKDYYGKACELKSTLGCQYYAE